MSGSEPLSTRHKALHINLENRDYGVFAEIGAGQEVARWFFKVGGAAGTIAKTMSAYDMKVSDAIYGPAERYVSRQRLGDMLDHEFRLLTERLAATRGATTRFFVFANTMAARGYRKMDECHGWMGILFQDEPGASPSQILVHVRMLDKDNVQQQEAIGIIGVNLVYGALYVCRDPITLLSSLLDNLARDRVEVDMIKFSGPAFAGVDNRIMSLELVRQGLADAAMFTSNGEVVQAAELLYKKPILVERGSFRPVTKLTLDMLDCAQAQFVQEPEVHGKAPVVLFEMTLNNLADSGVIDHGDFLDRVDLAGSLGKTVLISNYAEFYRLAGYLFRYSKEPIGLVMGVPTLKELFDEKYYSELDGGILESFGRLFRNGLKLYVYPMRDPASGSLITAGNLLVAPNLRNLYAHLMESLSIQSLRDFDERCLPIFSRDVLAKIRSGDPTWQDAVPPQVASLIQERGLFGWPGAETRSPAAPQA